MEFHKNWVEKVKRAQLSIHALDQQTNSVVQIPEPTTLRPLGAAPKPLGVS